MQETEKEHISLLQRGDKAAFTQLFELYFEKLVKAAEFFLQDVELAEDLVMDVFTFFIENPEKFKGVENLNAYLFRLTKNRALNKIRHLGVRDKHQERIVEALLFAEIPDQNDFQEKLTKVNEVINELAPRTKEVFSSCVVNGKTYKEVAAEFDISVNTVNTLIKRAYKTIRSKCDVGLALLIDLLFF